MEQTDLPTVSEDRIVIYIVDDNGILRDRLDEALSDMLPSRKIEIARKDSVKHLSESWSEGQAVPRAGDIAVCDLFDIEHYNDEGPEKTHHKRKQVRSDPESVENIKLASLDNLERFFPLLVNHKLRILVFSHVLKLLENTGDWEGLKEVKGQLAHLGIGEDRVFSKQAPRKVDPFDLEPVVKRIAQMLEER